MRSILNSGGNSWAAQIEDEFIIPDSVSVYESFIADGILPPVGFAPDGYEGTAAPGTSGSESAQGGSTGADVSFDGPVEVYDISGLGKGTVTYPSDTFFYDDSAILDTIAAVDGSVEIAIVNLISPEDHDAVLEGFETWVDYDKYSYEELTVAGYDAYMVTYEDFFYDCNAEIYVDFGGEINGWYGVKFCITSTESIDMCLSDTVMAIINSFEMIG